MPEKEAAACRRRLMSLVDVPKAGATSRKILWMMRASMKALYATLISPAHETDSTPATRSAAAVDITRDAIQAS